MVKELANCKSLDLGKPCYLQKERGALLGMGILTSNGDLWVHQRKVIAPELFMERVKLTMVIQETLRLYPPASFVARGSSE
ncbi:hypothetical protein OsI_34896 [Oryza sativa Indica Group]|uniref:Uncharacterized protein n=1 Tax=Oryza sativa subsp. indica TaxID=39946 RepID=B8BIS4_ORYSI|nr:hypothetical protein OsI_34896 [Oryza sativa Indica Group]